jgi:S-methylmethionine-dependent homocysteine/selenocysteine methylase
MQLSRDHNQMLLLDGGMGNELMFRGVNATETIWSAGALITNQKRNRWFACAAFELGSGSL